MIKNSLSEQQLNVKKTSDGKVTINGHKYRLEVKKPLIGWFEVDIEDLVPTEQDWVVTASLGAVKQTKKIPQTALQTIKQNIGKSEIYLADKKHGDKRLIKEQKDMKVVKLNESNLKAIINRVLSEHEHENYMFFTNLEQIKKQCEMLLELDPHIIDEIIQNGHDWADDHVSEAKNNMDQVFDFMMNETKKMKSYIDYEMIDEGRKKTGTKLCARGKAAAKAKYKVYPSAYGNGYGVQVCKGDIAGLDGKKRCSPPYC
jgi:hypothetical protein